MTANRGRKRREAPENKIDVKKMEERFDHAFLVTLGIFALFFLLVFIPVVGPILILILIPYVAGYHGGKFVNRKDGILVAVLAGFIWTLLEIWIFYSLLSSLDLAVNPPGIYTGLDWTVIILIFLTNIMFCIMGVLYSPRKFSEHDSNDDKEP